MNAKKALAFFAGVWVFFSLPAQLLLSAEEGTQRQKTIAVLGSSVAAGWATSRERKHDMKNGYAQRLGRRLEGRGFNVVNVSVPGDTTDKVLARLDKDLFPLKPDYVVIGLSLENEGIRGLWGKDPETVYAGFLEGLRRIISRCREHGIVPILGSCYANDNFVQAAQYAFIKKLNFEIAGWDVPSINLLGALDNGEGQFVPEIAFDLDHPADLGHRELFLSIVPSLFQALASGKPLPLKETGSGFTALGNTGSRVGLLSHVPMDPVHSFTSAIEFRPRSRGSLFTVFNLAGAAARMSFAEDGHLVYRSSRGIETRLKISLLDNAWHHLGVVHHGLKNETVLYIDGTPGVAIPETLRPVQFVVGGADSAEVDCRDWLIFRAPLNADEMNKLHSGALLQSSLEVYAPLRGEKLRPNMDAVNRAQSEAKVFASPVDAEREIAKLREEWKREDDEEKAFVDPLEKKAIIMAPGMIESCLGTYDGPPGLALTLERRGVRLVMQFNGGREGTIELFPMSPERFFAKSVGPEIEVVFGSDKNRDGRSESLVLKVGEQEIPAKRKQAGLPDRAPKSDYSSGPFRINPRSIADGGYRRRGGEERLSLPNAFRDLGPLIKKKDKSPHPIPFNRRYISCG